MKILTVGGAMIDTIAIIDSDRIERMTMLNADFSFLLLEEGRKTEAKRFTHPAAARLTPRSPWRASEWASRCLRSSEPMRGQTQSWRALHKSAYRASGRCVMVALPRALRPHLIARSQCGNLYFSRREHVA